MGETDSIKSVMLGELTRLQGMNPQPGAVWKPKLDSTGLKNNNKGQSGGSS